MKNNMSYYNKELITAVKSFIAKVENVLAVKFIKNLLLLKTSFVKFPSKKTG